MKSANDSDAKERSLPSSLEAEMAVLGAMMLAPETAGKLAMARLTDKDFRQPAHQIIFLNMAAILSSASKPDLITLTQRLRQRDLIEDVGGPAYLSDLIALCPTTANIEHYIDLVADRRCS